MLYSMSKYWNKHLGGENQMERVDRWSVEHETPERARMKRGLVTRLRTGVGMALILLGGAIFLTTCENPSGTSNVYTCSNGTAASGSPSSNMERCVSCDDGYILSNERCVVMSANMYTCSNGTPVSGTPATAGVERCMSCDSSYKLVNNLCEATEYTCANGTASSGSPPDNADVAQCASCDSTYRLISQTCNTRTAYTCTGGTPQTGNPSGNDDVEECVSCTSGLAPDATTNQCATSFAYICDNGTAQSGTIGIPNTQLCVSCDSTYKLASNACTERTVYTCTNGIPTSGNPSGNVDVAQCASCNSGFLPPAGGVCATATSYTCTNGTPSSGSPPGDENVEQCASCRSGYYLMAAQQLCVNQRLSNVDNESDTSALRLDGASSVTTATVGGTTYLYAAGYDDDGVSVFSVANNGVLTSVQNVPDTSALQLDGATSVTTATVGTGTYLFVAGWEDNGVSVFSIANNGMLTSVQNVPDTTSLNLSSPSSVTTATVGTATYLFVAGYDDGGVSVFSIANNGMLTSVHNTASFLTSTVLLTARSVTTATVGGTTYLFVAVENTNSVRVFSVASTTGALTFVRNLTDSGGLQIANPYSVTTATVGTGTYLFVAGYNDDGVSVFSIGTGGTLTNAHNQADDRFLRLNGASSVTTATVGGTTYLFVAGYDDDGVSTFSVANDGTLTSVHNVDDSESSTLELDGAYSVTTATVGGTTYLFVAGRDDDGVSVFSVNE